MTDAVRFANMLLTTAIGHAYHNARTEERIDMSVSDFTKLREAAKIIIEKEAERQTETT